MFSKTAILSLLAPLALPCLVMVHAQGLFELPPDVVYQITYRPEPSPFISVPPLKARDAGNEEEEGSEGMEGVEGNLNLNVDVPTTLVTAVRPGNTDALVWEGERNKGR